MFCDLVGSSALAQHLDLEEFRDVVRAFQDQCASIVREFGGTVSRYMGDALLVMFGYPRAGEDDAERAVVAGLRMASAIPAIELPRQPDERLAVRVGIATGLVVVGDWIGEGASLEQAVLGETPNLAARLQALAPPNSVVVSGATRALIGSQFVCENLGMQSVKGFDAPVAVWRVCAVGPMHNRFHATRAATLTPLVDREEELAWLERLWDAATQQRGRVALVSGEPGIGKSRLVDALRQRIGEGQGARVNLQCSPYYTNRALHPIVQYIEGAVSLDKEDSPETKVKRLAQWLGAASSNAHAISLLGGLLSIPVADRPPLPPMTASRHKALTFELLTELLRNLTLTQPLLLVCEDLQWIDPTSEEFLTHLISRIPRMPILAVCTHRMEYVPRWQEAERRPLRRLNVDQARILVERVAGPQELPGSVVNELVAASDGVPLFVEEVTRAALHEAAANATASGETRLRGPLSIPSSLHDALLARLDQLGPERQVAQLASVIGREFNYPLLQAISSLPPDQLHAGILALERAGLVFADKSGPGTRYSFNHALIREAAYETLLRRRRRDLHALAAEVLERQFPQTASETPELVAHHWSEAGRPERAVANWVVAGQRARERSEYREAIGHIQRALQLIPQLAGAAERCHRELELLLELAPSLIVTQGAGTPEVNRLYARALALCEELPKSAMHFAARWGWWRVSMDHRSGRGRAQELLGLARELGDPGLVVQAHHAQWATLYMLGEHDQCCRHADAGMRIYDPARHRFHGGIYGGHDAKVCALGESALSAWLLGRVDEALDRVSAALAWADELGHAGSRVHAMDYALQLHRFRGDAREVARRADELVTYAVEQHLDEHRAKGRIFRGWARARLEPDANQAFEEIRCALAAEKSAATPEDFPQYYEMFADVCARARQVDTGLAAVDEALELAERGGFVYWNAELLRRRAELLIVADAAPSAIDAHFQEALACARAQGALSLALRAASSRARFCAGGARAAEANGVVQELLAQFRQGLSTVDVIEARQIVSGRQ
jgi:class 3 adenylate cyclase/tetratricopeptide (TPR) repeat protein